MGGFYLGGFCYTFDMKYSDFLKTVTTCPFCARHDDEIIIDTEHAFLTYSLAPYHKHHMLVVPKRHFSSFLELTSLEMAEIDTLQKRALKILQKLGYKNVSFMVREGDGSGKSIEHLHYHVIPDIQLGDGDHSGADRLILEEGERKALFSELKSAAS